MALENWDEFIKAEIIEDNDGSENYPVGKGYLGIRIHFMHYAAFNEAIGKWNERKKRIDMDNAVIMFTNYSGGVSLERFDKLPFPNKVVFVGEKHPDIKSAVYLSGFKKFCKFYKRFKQIPNIWMTKNLITGKRFIDQFDYVGYFNSILGDKNE